LTAGQREYAALDVCLLPRLHDHLAERLTELGRLDWQREECERLLARRTAREGYDEAYLKLANLHHLDRRSLGVLRALCAWREHEARARDVPRAHLVRDEILLDIARRRPESRAELFEVEGLPHRFRGRLADIVLSIVGKVEQLGEGELPPSVRAPSTDRRHRSKLKALKARVVNRATELGIAPELLARTSSLDDLATQVLEGGIATLTPHFAGWRATVIGEELLALLAEQGTGEPP
jgi:ribonuclease D